MKRNLLKEVVANLRFAQLAGLWCAQLAWWWWCALIGVGEVRWKWRRGFCPVSNPKRASDHCHSNFLAPPCQEPGLLTVVVFAGELHTRNQATLKLENTRECVHDTI